MKRNNILSTLTDTNLLFCGDNFLKNQINYLPAKENYCVTADYTIKDEKSFLGWTVGVHNHAEEKDGTVHDTDTLCAAPADKNDPAKLQVAPCFLPTFAAGPYWVLAYDETEVRVAQLISLGIRIYFFSLMRELIFFLHRDMRSSVADSRLLKVMMAARMVMERMVAACGSSRALESATKSSCRRSEAWLTIKVLI